MKTYVQTHRSSINNHPIMNTYFMICLFTVTISYAMARCPITGLSEKDETSSGFQHSQRILSSSTTFNSLTNTPTTNKGCKCTSTCGATADFGLATCDWCYTENKCGHYSYSVSFKRTMLSCRVPLSFRHESYHYIYISVL